MKLDYEWIEKHSGVKYIRVNQQFPYEQMLEEAKNLPEKYYINNYVKEENNHQKSAHEYDHGGVDLATLHGIEWNTFSRGSNYKWTETAAHCPIITNFFKNSFPAKSYQRIRIARMQPGGFVSPHIDAFDNSTSMYQVNVALNNPGWRLWWTDDNTHVPFEDGSMFIIDPTQEHAGIHEGNEVRYHIIAHYNCDATWRKLVLDSYCNTPETLLQ